MFQGLQAEIKRLNTDVKNAANCEKAKALRKKLLAIGLPIAILGVVSTFVCFVLFVTAGRNGFGENGFTARLLVPFILFLPSGFVACVGISIARLGLQILVTGYAANLVDEAVGLNCPACKASVDEEACFCPSCGEKLKAVCPKCGKTNGAADKFCAGCGEAL